MKKDSPDQSGFLRLRVSIATTFLTIGAGLAMFSFAATPPNGTLTDTSGPVTYAAGPFFAPNAFGNSIAGECDPDPTFPLVPCDIFRLTVTLPNDYAQTHPNYSLFVRVDWPTPAADFDLYFWDAINWPTDSFPSGNPIAQSKQTVTTFEQVEIPAVGGTHQYVVQVSTTFPAGQSFTGRISLGPASPGQAPVVPPGNASGVPPRFQEYIPTDANGAPSSSLGLFAGEPTMGVNAISGNLLYQGLLEVLRV